MNIASNMAVSSTAEKDIVERDKKGEAAFKIFVANRLVKATAKIPMWDPMKKPFLDRSLIGKRKNGA